MSGDGAARIRIAGPLRAVRGGRYLALVGALAALYCAAAKLGLSLAFDAPQVSPVWPPTGIALAAVLLLGYRVWPGIALGAFVANVTAQEPVATAAGIALGNTLEALAGSWLLLRLAGFRGALERLRDVLALVLLAAGVSPAIAATVGVTSLALGGLEPWSRFGELWGVWWLGDAMGALVVAPALLVWLSGPGRSYSRRWALELSLLVAALVLAGLVVFGIAGVLPPDSPLLYTIFPFVIWAALRFGARGATLITLATSVVAIVAAVAGAQPIDPDDAHRSLVLLQVFMAVVAVTGLFLAAAIAERDRAERDSAEALRRSGDRFRSLVSASAQVVWNTTADGEVVDDLPSWREFTGQARDAMMGRGWITMLHPNDREETAREWQRSLETGTPHTIEFRVCHRDGGYREVLARTVPVLEDDGGIREWVGTLTDITERKALDRELHRRAEALAEADRRKDEFLAMLGHELRNPLAPISHGLELLRARGGSGAEDERRLEMLGRQVQHLTRLVDDLLDVARITRGEITLHRAAIDLRAVAERGADAVRPMIESRRHRLRVEQPAGPVPVDADADRLQQVVTNLLHNAAKYTEPGGELRLAVAREGAEAVLRVTDDGAGIRADLLPRVFDLFAQGDRALDRAHGGLGIGLTLVRRIVEMHGGAVEAASEGPGRGSEFTVRLPAAPAVPAAAEPAACGPGAAGEPAPVGAGGPTPDPVVAAPAPAAGGPAPGPLQVLVVDDHRDAAESLGELLRLLGHSAEVVHDGPAALAAAAERPPDVVLLDLGLPGMDGYQVARRLRAVPALGAGVLLVAVSGYGQDEDRRRSNAAGIDHHLVKPVALAELERLLATRGARRVG